MFEWASEGLSREKVFMDPKTNKAYTIRELIKEDGNNGFGDRLELVSNRFLNDYNDTHLFGMLPKSQRLPSPPGVLEPQAKRCRVMLDVSRWRTRSGSPRT